MQKRTYHASDHEINPNYIDLDALEVINRLREAGYETYLVGGSVRDLLAKKTPKDFDISTAARPEEIKKVFGRRCLLIGRRFRLAHIRFGHKIIEVATFRTGENSSDLITRDNQWGTPEEDVLRRDFTINGLFYDPHTHSVIDYVGGWDDIHQGILRSIGDAATRFRQDPVRMIRLLKFKARFGFKISEECQNALYSCKEEILKSAPARVLEEVFRMLESGASKPFFKLMAQSNLLELLFPCLTHFMEGKHGNEVYDYLKSADIINTNAPTPINRDVLASCLLFPIIEHEIKLQFLDKDITPHLGDIMLLTTSIIKGFVTSSFSHFPRRMSATIAYIISTQYRFTPFSGKRHYKPRILHHKEFPYALNFFEIRSMIDPTLQDEYSSWNQLYNQQTRHRRTPHPPPRPKRGRRYGGQRKRSDH